MKSLNLKGTREARKAIRSKKVGNIVVTVDGMAFDGDEASQQRMALRAQRMRANGQSTVRWVLADNTKADVTVEQLEQALDLALQAQSKLWLI